MKRYKVHFIEDGVMGIQYFDEVGVAMRWIVLKHKRNPNGFTHSKIIALF